MTNQHSVVTPDNDNHHNLDSGSGRGEFRNIPESIPNSVKRWVMYLCIAASSFFFVLTFVDWISVEYIFFSLSFGIIGWWYFYCRQKDNEIAHEKGTGIDISGTKFPRRWIIVSSLSISCFIVGSIIAFYGSQQDSGRMTPIIGVDSAETSDSGTQESTGSEVDTNTDVSSSDSRGDRDVSRIRERLDEKSRELDNSPPPILQLPDTTDSRPDSGQPRGNQTITETVTRTETQPSPSRSTSSQEVYFDSCQEAIDQGATPLESQDPGFRPELDYDNDGIACNEEISNN